MYHPVAEECAKVSCGTVGPKPAPGPGEEVIPGIPPGECCPGWIVQCIPSNCPTQDWDSCSWPKVYNITDETLCCSTFECGQFVENMTMWHGDKFSSGFYSGKVRIKTARNPYWNTVMGEYTTAMIEQYNRILYNLCLKLCNICIHLTCWLLDYDTTALFLQRDYLWRHSYLMQSDPEISYLHGLHKSRRYPGLVTNWLR